MLLRKIEVLTRKRDAVSLPDKMWVDVDKYREFYAEHYQTEAPTRSALIELMIDHMLKTDKDFSRYVNQANIPAKSPKKPTQPEFVPDTSGGFNGSSGN